VAAVLAASLTEAQRGEWYRTGLLDPAELIRAVAGA
jgi:hypothetical protein